MRPTGFDEPEDGNDVNNNHYALGVNVMGSTVQNNGEVVNFINVGQNPFGNSITETSTQTVFHQVTSLYHRMAMAILTALMIWNSISFEMLSSS